MLKRYETIAETPNGRGAEMGIGFSVSGNVSSLQTGITKFFKSQQPRKTWALLADLLGVGERVAKHRLANTRSYTIEELQIMLQSDNGYEILELLMDESKPRWWAMLQETVTLARARHHQELARQQVLKLEAAPFEIPTRRKAKRIADADRQLSSSRSRKETALGFLLADSSGLAVGTMASAQTQAMPSRKAGGRR